MQVEIDLVLLKKLKYDCKQAYIKVTGPVLPSESGFDEDYQLMGSAK